MPTRVKPPHGGTATRPLSDDRARAADGPTAPVIVLSYTHCGAHLVQQALAAGTDLACTTSTGILPLCEMAAATWARIDDRPVETMSQLAVSSIRTMVTVQLTGVLAAAGKRRWCELAVSPPSAAQVFLQVVPASNVVCVHRACPDFVRAAAEAQPWGLTGPALSWFSVAYPGNSVAALAAYWASSTEQLLAFEAANPQAASRVRYEDVAADADAALGGLRSSLKLGPNPGLGREARQRPAPDVFELAGLAPVGRSGEHPQVPMDMVPAGLRERIDHLHAELGYSGPA